jgi:hypothetical protein
MKKKSSLDVEKTIYHTTSYGVWEKIKKDKFLTPQGSIGAGLTYKDSTKEEMDSFNGYLFFSTTIEEAKNYSEYFSGKIAILEISVPTNILLPDHTDCSDCKDWKESEKKIKQVCIRGKVPIGSVKKVYVIYN